MGRRHYPIEDLLKAWQALANREVAKSDIKDVFGIPYEYIKRIENGTSVIWMTRLTVDSLHKIQTELKNGGFSYYYLSEHYNIPINAVEQIHRELTTE